MDDQNVSWWVKYRKDLFLTLAAITTVVVGVLGWHWTETAEKPFWWVFWAVAAVTADVLFICAWVYFRSRDRR